MQWRRRKNEHIALDELTSEEWMTDMEFVEVPVRSRIFLAAKLFTFFMAAVVVFRMVAIGPFQFGEYSARAEANLHERALEPAPRGLIVDRNQAVLAENQPSFLLFLKLGAFLEAGQESEIVDSLAGILDLTAGEIRDMVSEGILRDKPEILIAEDLSEAQLVTLRTSPNLPIVIKSGFKRKYTNGQVLASVLGYTGRVTEEEIRDEPAVKDHVLIGKAGIERFYDSDLRGQNGFQIQRRDAHGAALGEPELDPAEPGKSLRLTIDSELQAYMYRRLGSGLQSLGRQSGVALAMNPSTGEVLALVSFPSYDNNVLSSPGKNEEKAAILTSPFQPLFNRVISGFYSPGSTVKPLVAVAALHEKVITPDRSIYSPGYLDVPNPYDPEKPTRFLDWRPQGYVNAVSAIAQSSNVYFYEVGGGFGDIAGLGISRLLFWWDLFGLGKKTGIDMAGEAAGKLPDVENAEKVRGRPWTLGDTYNVSIGQGDLQVTPLQILNYVNTIGNGGTLYRPHLLYDTKPEVLADLTHLASQIRWAQKGMELGVTGELGTSHLLDTLPIKIAAKTGTAQTKNKAEENAFFVGYTPTVKPEFSILILVENAREGSLNAVPIAKDIFEWYYLHRSKDLKIESKK